MHLTYENLQDRSYGGPQFRDDVDIDSHIFYSVPTSFFVVDSRIPKIIRELITEAAGCIKMNYMTGASACTRKAIYELLIEEGVEGRNYDEKIDALKDTHRSLYGCWSSSTTVACTKNSSKKNRQPTILAVVPLVGRLTDVYTLEETNGLFAISIKPNGLLAVIYFQAGGI